MHRDDVFLGSVSVVDGLDMLFLQLQTSFCCFYNAPQLWQLWALESLSTNPFPLLGEESQLVMRLSSHGSVSLMLALTWWWCFSLEWLAWLDCVSLKFAWRGVASMNIHCEEFCSCVWLVLDWRFTTNGNVKCCWFVLLVCWLSHFKRGLQGHLCTVHWLTVRCGHLIALINLLTNWWKLSWCKFISCSWWDETIVGNLCPGSFDWQYWSIIGSLAGCWKTIGWGPWVQSCFDGGYWCGCLMGFWAGGISRTEYDSLWPPSVIWFCWISIWTLVTWLTCLTVKSQMISLCWPHLEDQDHVHVCSCAYLGFSQTWILVGIALLMPVDVAFSLD